MTVVAARDVSFDVDGIVFDKDGTLVDLDASWSAAGLAWVATASSGDDEVAAGLAEVLGLELDGPGLVPDGLLAAGTVEEISAAALAFLVRAGVPRARRRNGRARLAALAEAADPVHMQPIGEVASAIRRLAGSGLALAVLTSDDRAVAATTLAVLGVVDHIAVLVGGDDRYAAKPSPEGLLHIAATLGLEPSRLLMVGDSTADVEAGRAAGVAGTVAVGERSPAAPIADAVVASIDELET